MQVIPYTPAARSSASLASSNALFRIRSMIRSVPLREGMVAAAIVLLASAIATANEHLQEWIPDALAFPEDAQVVTDRAIGSTIRMMSISTAADVDDLLANWEESLETNGFPVSQSRDDLIENSIEFSGPGIVNAKILVGPADHEGQSIIEFDATLN